MNLRQILSFIYRAVMQFIFGVLLVTYLASRSSWAESIVNRFWAYPELRIQEYMPEKDIKMDNQWRLERIAVVKNLGNAPAQNVFMHVFLPSGRITRYNVVSQELYRVKENKLSEGEIGIWLDRLGSGAAVSIYIWGVQSGTSQGLIDISVTSDRGCAFPDDKPTVIEEVKSYGDFIIQEFLAGIRYILEQEDIRSLRDFPFVQRILFLAQNRDFQAAIIAMALIVGGCWLFLGRRSALIAMDILVMLFILTTTVLAPSSSIILIAIGILIMFFIILYI